MTTLRLRTSAPHKSGKRSVSLALPGKLPLATHLLAPLGVDTVIICFAMFVSSSASGPNPPSPSSVFRPD